MMSYVYKGGADISEDFGYMMVRLSNIGHICVWGGILSLDEGRAGIFDGG